jgi:putative peptidoglycan lipid II flippase
VLGGVAQLALQWPLLRREGFHWQPRLDWRDPGLQRVLMLMGPGTIGLAATQVNVFVNTVLATQAGPGAVSWLTYAFRIMYLPIGLFGVSIATAVLPTVSRQIALKDEQAARNTVADGMSLMMMLNVPAMIGLVVLATPIVQLLFERRAFTPADTANTAAALQFYALGLIGYSVVRIASPTFYALGLNRIPVMVSIATVVVNAVLNIALVRAFGFRGLALGTSIAALFNATTLLFILNRKLHGLNGGRLTVSLLRIAVATAAMGAAAWFTSAALQDAIAGNSVVLQTVRLVAAIGVALITLAAAAWLLRIREFHESVQLVTRRFSRK